MKIFTPIFVAAALALTSLPAQAKATYFTVDGVRYKSNTAVTSVNVVSAGTGKTYVGDIVIPAKIVTTSNGELPVIGVGSSAFSECDELTSVILPESVTQSATMPSTPAQNSRKLKCPESRPSVTGRSVTAKLLRALFSPKV